MMFNFRKNIITALLVLTVVSTSRGRISYAGRIEVGRQQYAFRTVRVDPGPNWKGYVLDNKQNGFSIASSNGLSFVNKKLYAGIGLEYFNFEGIDGVSVFGDFEYLPLKAKVSPFFNLRVGYNHLWNQYEGGNGTIHTEFLLGLNYSINEKYGLYTKSGMLLMQQSLLIPITLGFRF